jgi:hypothetical protein
MSYDDDDEDYGRRQDTSMSAKLGSPKLEKFSYTNLIRFKKQY